MTSASDGTLEERRYFCQNWRADVVAVTKPDGTPIEYVRYSSYGEPAVYPVADLNMDGVVNSSDVTEWSNLVYGSPSSAVYADSDLDWDGLDDWNSGGADGDLFAESYNANTGLSGVGRVSSPGVASRTAYAGYQWDQTLSACHVRYRVYLPDIGRWMRRDPLGYVDGMGLYEYVASQVVAGVDPSGLGSEFVGPPHPCDVFEDLYRTNQLLEAAMLDICGFDQDLQLWWDAGRFTGGTSSVLFEIAAAQVEKGAREAAFRAAKYKARGRRRGDWGLFLSNHYEEVGARRLKRAAKCVPIAGDAFTIVDGVCTHDYGQVQQGVCSHLLDYFGSWGRAAGLIGDVGTLLIDARTDWVQRKSVGDQRASACAFLKSVWQARQQSLHQAWADCWSTVFRWPWSR